MELYCEIQQNIALVRELLQAEPICRPFYVTYGNTNQTDIVGKQDIKYYQNGSILIWH